MSTPQELVLLRFFPSRFVSEPLLSPVNDVRRHSIQGGATSCDTEGMYVKSSREAGLTFFCTSCQARSQCSVLGVHNQKEEMSRVKDAFFLALK